MKIYTKKGDEGMTTLFGSGLISKTDPRIEFLGAIDELNSTLGVTLCFLEDQKLKSIISKIQNDLFQLGADVAGSGKHLPKIKKEHVQELEGTIDELEASLGIPQKFILPGGTHSSAFLHLCRAMTRRAERNIVFIKEKQPINPEILCYLNRLSDLLYVLAREANMERKIDEQQPIYKYFPDEDTAGKKDLS